MLHKTINKRLSATSHANGISVAETAAMNISDFLIIYLACGAPVGVSFYFQNRRLHFKQLWLKTILNFIFWIPFFVQTILKSRILRDFRKNSSNSKSNLDSARISRMIALQRNLENVLSESAESISVYEFREVCERFAGLSLAGANKKTQHYAHEKEFFRVAGNLDNEISARCLHRRNLKRLYFHQTEAEKDFLQMIRRISESARSRSDLRRSAAEFAELSNSSTAIERLKEIFKNDLQIVSKIPVRDLEKDLWTPDLHKPPAVTRISTSSTPIGRKAK